MKTITRSEISKNTNWAIISSEYSLSEDFIREFKDNVNWYNISTYQKLSEDFIREFKDKVKWNYISASQKLSEDFIREFKDNVNWDNISEYQKLSEDFIREFKDKVYWYYISINQKLSKKFRKEFNLNIPPNSWMYKSIKEKKDYIKKNTNYEIVGDSIIAYKAVREGGYSVINWQYKYEVGKEYESTADYNSDEENSFGISAWIKEKALEYYNKGELLQVEIKIRDIACIVHNGNKVRAVKIKILERINI